MTASEAWGRMIHSAAEQLARGEPFVPLVLPVEETHPVPFQWDPAVVREVVQWGVYIATDGKQGEPVPENKLSRDVAELFATITRQVLDDIRNNKPGHLARVAKQIRMPAHGYATLHRTPRMVLDTVNKHQIPLNVVEKHKLTEWHPESLSINALSVLLACVAKLTEEDALPDLRIRDSDSIAESITRVTVRFPDGYSELADYASFPRTRTDGKGPRHDPNTFDQVKEGIKELTQPRDMYHVWSEWNPKKGKKGKYEKRMRRVYAAIAELINDSVEQLDEQGHKVFQPHAQYIALHPFVLIGARERFADLPGDLPARPRRALLELAERGKEDAELRGLVGARPRQSPTDQRFLLWCYMHRAQVRYTITNDKLMDQLGLTPMIENDNRGRAEKAFRRAIEVAKQDGVLMAVECSPNGAPVYLFHQAPDDSERGEGVVLLPGGGSTIAGRG